MGPNTQFGRPVMLISVFMGSLVAAACGQTQSTPTTSPSPTTASLVNKGCPATLQLSQSTIGLKGGQIQLTVTTQTECRWNVTLPTWVRMVSKVFGTGDIGIGSVTVWIEVAAATSPRDGFLSIGAASAHLYQETDCSIGLGRTPSFDEMGGHASVPLTTSLSMCSWVVEAADWIQVQPSSGTGSATLAVDVSPSQSARSGLISTTGSAQGVFQTPAGATRQFGFSSLSCGTIRPGESKVTLCWFFVAPGTSPASSGIWVTADLRSIGGRENAGALNEMGTDGLGFSLDVRIPGDLTPGTKAIPLVAHDAQGRTATAVATMPVLPPK